MGKIALSIIALALPLLAAAPAQAQQVRTWVSGTGDDNSTTCSRSAPCKTFQAAHNKTAPGGEINCADRGDFGGVTISQSITISCEAGTASILGNQMLVGGFGAGVFVSAAATDVVTLRGLDIDGQSTGGVGMRIDSAKAVHIEKCTIRNFRLIGPSSVGISAGGSTTIFLFIVDTVISDNTVGVNLSRAGNSLSFQVTSLKNVTITNSINEGLRLAASNVYANVADSVISGNGGSAVIALAPNTTVNIERSTLANNAVAALNAAGSGSIIRASGNGIYNNTNGFLIGTGATIQSDGTNETGGSNGGMQTPNASFAQY